MLCACANGFGGLAFAVMANAATRTLNPLAVQTANVATAPSIIVGRSTPVEPSEDALLIDYDGNALKI